MCEACEEIDRQIALYRQVAVSIGDPAVLDEIVRQVDDLMAQKRALHSDDEE
jgi:hypothetical protein